MSRFVLFGIVFCCSLAVAAQPYADVCQSPSGAAPSGYNIQVLRAAHSMPEGGGYQDTDDRIEALSSAIEVKNGKIAVDPQKAGASFCSAGTYLVFLKVISEQQSQGELHLDPQTAQELMVLGKAGEPDGYGIWGRWNADGPGPSVLFKELELGRNFSDTSEAQAGDFMKIFWNDKIGKGESGHLVVFDSVRDCSVQNNTVKHVCFWSTNTSNDVEIPGDKKGTPGWGFKCVPQTKVVRATFSRLESLANLNTAAARIGKNSGHYIQAELSSLGNRSLSPSEMERLIQTAPDGGEQRAPSR